MKRVFAIAVGLAALGGRAGTQADEAGDTRLVVEHWDAYMPVPPKDQWLNDNGSF
jgi:hypothetical protein